MSIKPHVAALRTLFAAANPADQVQLLILYTSAASICDDVKSRIERIPNERKPEKAQYFSENLMAFIGYFQMAAMPNEHGDAKHWLGAAESNLDKLMDAGEIDV